MIVNNNIPGMSDTSSKSNDSTSAVTQSVQQDTHTVLSQSQDIQTIIDTNDVDLIVDFFENTDQITAYSAMELLSPELGEKVLPKLSVKRLARLFNNFHGKLPGGYQSTFYTEFNQTHKGELDKLKNETIKKPSKKYSDRYKTSTFWSFYGDIAQVAQENWVNINEVFGAKDTIENPHTPTRVSTELLVPIYSALRKLGYNHQELVE